MLKPRDIANIEFRQAWRGYNEADVDEFVEKVITAYETLYQENERLREQTGKLQGRIDEYAQTGTQIDETLVFARQVAADTKSAAERQADAIIAAAEARAREIVRGAQQQVDEHASRVMELFRQGESFRNRFRDLLESYWALLEEERRDAERLTREVARLTDEAAAAAEDGVRADDESFVPAPIEEDDWSVAPDGPGDETRVWTNDDMVDEFDVSAPTRRIDPVRDAPSSSETED